jgi:hypothetical protein
MTDGARIRQKADAARAAWRLVLGGEPSENALVLALAVADRETRMGDAWPGEHNWGWLHRRSLSAAERNTLSSSGLDVDSAKASQLSRARALLVAGPGEALHIDTGPDAPYYVWTYAFPTDAEGAAKFLEVLVKKRPAVAAILDSATPLELARAMYGTPGNRYFTGNSHDDATNVRAYAAHIASHAEPIALALEGAPPGPSPAKPSSDALAVVLLLALGAWALSRSSSSSSARMRRAA